MGSFRTATADGVVKDVAVARGITAAALAKVVANVRDKAPEYIIMRRLKDPDKLRGCGLVVPAL